MDYNVFISYSSSDKVIADAICTNLEANKTGCWIAPRDILPGTEYGEAIIDGIEACGIFLLVFSSKANDSPQVRREVERAVSKGKKIISFRIEDILPTRALEFALSNTHWLDAINAPVEFHFSTLLCAIQRLLKVPESSPSGFSGHKSLKEDAVKNTASGESWTMRTTSGPGQRSDFGMVYDDKRELIILHGGFGHGNVSHNQLFHGLSAMMPEQNDTWAWDGAEWKLLSSGTMRLRGHDMTFDRITGQTLILGGWTGSQRIKSTYVLNHDNWIQADAGNAFDTGGFHNHAVTYDEKRKTVIMFGGLTITLPGGQRALGDTWEWNGSSWSQLHVNGPEPRWGHKMVYDQSSGVIILFGGNNGKTLFDDTWMWEGSSASWSKISPKINPSARSNHGMIYDSLRQRVLMFGGISEDKIPLNDLWEWNGQKWNLITEQAPPNPRYNHGFAYDAKRNKSVLFGGTDGKEFFRDTWEFGS